MKYPCILSGLFTFIDLVIISISLTICIPQCNLY